MKLREACVKHMQKHKERFSKVSIVETVCDVMQVGLMVKMNIGKTIVQKDQSKNVLDQICLASIISRAPF